MPYDLQGKKVLVTGGSRGLGELISYKFAQAGCEVAVNYVASEERAKGVAEKIERDYGMRAYGYTRFSTFSDLSAPTTEDWDKCYAVNVKAQALLMREAAATFNDNVHGGVFIMTSSIAGKTLGGSSMPYSVTKAAQLHLMRCLASTQGPNIRVNAVLPGWLATEWSNLLMSVEGVKYSEDRVKEMNQKAWLKKETDLGDCAQAFVDIARNTSMTGQRIQVDSGLGQND
ncbi:short chain dehydrogenase/reductase [Diplocarpon rosae]|nr:short chain dehydrogenase/reductase [Diplocarpon rosae]